MKDILDSKFVFNSNSYNINTGRIYFRKSFSNLFMTLTDLNDNVICCKTSGSCGIQGSKRRKTVPQAVETIFKEIYNIMKLFKIVQVELV